jgi:hypothetical protein
LCFLKTYFSITPDLLGDAGIEIIPGFDGFEDFWFGFLGVGPRTEKHKGSRKIFGELHWRGLDAKDRIKHV